MTDERSTEHTRLIDASPARVFDAFRDPAKLAHALLTIANQTPPPRRFVAGSEAIAGAEHKLADLKAEIESNRDLSTALAFD